jgi:predicted DNA-binding transcriptional regulator AlpA
MRGLSSMPGRPAGIDESRRRLRRMSPGAMGRDRTDVAVARGRLLGCGAMDTGSSRPSLIRPGDVAKDLAVSRTWVYDAANAGRIPSIRIGGEDGPLRFVPEDLDRWIDEAREAWRPGGGSVATRNPGDEGVVGERPDDGARRAGRALGSGHGARR